MLSSTQGAVVLSLRQSLYLPLDDLLYITRQFIKSRRPNREFAKNGEMARIGARRRFSNIVISKALRARPRQRPSSASATAHQRK
jgi:hypothetical protein